MLRVAVLAAVVASPAAAFVAENGMRARQVGPGEIAVAFEPQRDDTDYWCAAGDLVLREMGLPGGTRLWRASPKPRGAGNGIVFTLDPARQAEGAGLSQFGAGGGDGSISVSHAVQNLCKRRLPFFD